MPISETSVHFSAQDGLKLHAIVTGQPQPGRLPVLALPGLSRNARDFSGLAQIVAADPAAPRQVIALDYRGRGRSEWDKNWQNYNLLTEAQDVLAALAALNIPQAHFIGTSRGGLIIHLLAAMRPGAMLSVVLNDVGPEIGGAGLAQIRAMLDRMPKPASWADAERSVQQNYAKTFPAFGEADFARMARAIYRDTGKNGLVADFDPALINTLRAIDFNQPLPTMWPQFAGLKGHSMLVLRGEHSLLLTAETLAKMQAVAPRMRAATVPGQGHAPLLETGPLPQLLQQHFALAEQAAR
jgi:pimeloyl-ACP methyl ester carboxylesterase